MLISLEGVDGVGKSTVARELAALLPRALFLDRTHLKQWVEADEGRLLDMLQHAIWGGWDFENDPIGWEFWFGLAKTWFLALSRVALPRIDRANEYVIVDGWIYRHIVKASLRSGIPVESLRAQAVAISEPQLVFLLDASDESLDRRPKRLTHQESGLWEMPALAREVRVREYRAQIRRGMRKLASPYWNEVDADADPPRAIARRIADVVIRGVSNA